MVLRAVFPKLNSWLNGLPDPRLQEMCLYTAAHVWWHIIATYLSRKGSRNGFDEQRLSGQAAWNVGLLCGQTAEDPRFNGEPTVTCSDNAAYHASRVDSQAVAQIPVRMFRNLLERRLFDGARLFNRWYCIVVDGSVKEKCRQGFQEGGKSATNGARYRYVLQASVMGPLGTLFPVMHEEIDMHNPVRDKEDCELTAFARLSVRLKKEFPRLPICLIADSLYCCQAVVVICKQFDWRYMLTLKEGRQPTTWDETIRLLPLHRSNRLRCLLGQDGKEGQQDFRWVEQVLLGEHQTNVILQGEITAQPSANLYAYITNFSNLTPQRVAVVVNSGGRERHLIEDTFNAQKNNGIGLEHVFCANATASKNYYTMMQVAEILWTLTCHGGLRRLYDWARRATEQGLARAVWEGLRASRLPPDLPPLGQLRFSSA
ncbi:MAG TPA: hypothetical protein VN673_09220 [Clostridia bacterium]|nr:hypothetical protein [Clostridia bacterium]